MAVRTIFTNNLFHSVTNHLSTHGKYSFYDLTECSPRQEKTKRDCADAVRLILSSPALLLELEKTHKLPIKSLSASSGIPRKTLDRYRKYLIMAVLVLNGDYPFLQEYLKFMKEESRK